MKKRNLLVAFVLSLVMLFTACGQEANPFVGTWKGTCDLTDYFVSSIVEEDASMEQYAKFEDLELVFVFEFTEDEISLSLDETGTQQFVTNVETGVANMVDAMVADAAAEAELTAEDVYAAMGMTRDEFVEDTIATMHLDAMISAMAEALELSGTYTSSEDTITVIYEDNTYEEMKYAFDGEELTITVSDGTNDYPIKCVKEAK